MSDDKKSMDETEGTPDRPQGIGDKCEAPASDYEVGYRKPPHATRFQPGQSGNPRGRPKGVKNLKTDLTDELRKMIKIREGDRSRMITMQLAFVRSLLARAVKGDARATAILTNLIMRLLDTGAGHSEIDPNLSANEQDILDAYAERRRRQESESHED